MKRGNNHGRWPVKIWCDMVYGGFGRRGNIYFIAPHLRLELANGDDVPHDDDEENGSHG